MIPIILMSALICVMALIPHHSTVSLVEAIVFSIITTALCTLVLMSAVWGW